MDKLSAQELFEQLTSVYSKKEKGEEDDISGSFATLKAQKINGKRALAMSTNDFFNLGIAYGDAMDLKALIEEVNQEFSSQPKVKPTEEVPFSEDVGSHFMPYVPTQSNEMDSMDTLSSQIVEKNSEDFSDIEPYFSPKTFREMSDYDKAVHQNVKRRYETFKESGIIKEMPGFMKPKKKKQKTVQEHSDQSSKQTEDRQSTSSSLSKPVRKAANVKKTSSKKLSEEQYSAQLPSYDIDKILSACKGKRIRELESTLKSLEGDKPLSSKHTKLLIRTLVYSVFCDASGSFKLGVTSNEKEGLAATIVKACPFLKDTTQKEKFSWWRVYDRQLNRGRIPNVISNLQRKVEKEGPATPANESEPDEDQTEDESSNTGKIDDFLWLSLLVPSTGEHNKIMAGMKDSFIVRKRWIRECNRTVHDVLEKFPHLISYGGELIEEDFKMLYPELNHSALLQVLPQFLSKRKVLETFPPLEDKLMNDEIQGCICIAEKMPWQNLKRFGRTTRREKLIIENLVLIIPAGTDVRNVIEERRANSDSSVQPYLIVLVPESTITKMFAVADNKTIQIDSSSFVKGLDVLFKMYHVFDVEYPKTWTRFFEFLEYGMYKLNPSKLTNSMKDFMTRVDASETA